MVQNFSAQKPVMVLPNWAALDKDNNGWIDESDDTFSQLRVWTKDSAGNDQLKTLKQANVSALSLSRSSTLFDLERQQQRPARPDPFKWSVFTGRWEGRNRVTN